MLKQCKHCGSLYTSLRKCDEFCCAGCEQVHALIEEGGFNDYYMKQDRAGRPVGDEPKARIDHVSIAQLQMQAEPDCELTLRVRGMSCLACAWLVEQLATRMEGVRSARVSLDSHLLSLSWERDNFDLSKLAAELLKYGYSLSGEISGPGVVFSPLGLRLSLTTIFSFNGVLLASAARFGIGGVELELLYKLLITACMIFSFQIGGTLFVRPFWRGLLLRRIHRDTLPALVLLAFFILGIVAIFLPRVEFGYTLIYFLLLPLFVLLRWLSERRVLQASGA